MSTKVTSPWFAGFTYGPLLATVIVLLATQLSVLAKDNPSLARSDRPAFDKEGNLKLPTLYRKWNHVGMRIMTEGKSVLDGQNIVIPQVLNAYVEPEAFEAFEKTGIWPDGTQIIKEFSVVKSGEGCDAKTSVCQTVFGSGIFEDHYAGMGMMVKDSRRFPNEPGNWGYFTFLPDGKSYQSAVAARPRDQCAFCHIARASKTDYVFSASHIGLLQ